MDTVSYSGNIMQDKKFLFLLALFAAFACGILFYGAYSGIFLIIAILIFGALSLWWKEKHIKLAGLVFLILLSLLNIGVNGLKFGIDFKGGTRIQIILEKPVDSTTMNQLIDAIKKRTSTLGLSEVRVKAIGNSQVNVEVPSGDEARVKFIEEVLSHKGVYMGIIDGKKAITGDHIFSTSIKAQNADYIARLGVDWGVTFTVDQQGAKQFAEAAYGKGDYPIYMFLDRPSNTALFYSRNELRSAMRNDSGERETMTAIKDALKLEGEETILFYILDDINFTANYNLPDNASSPGFTAPFPNMTAFISENSSSAYREKLIAAGFTVKEFPDSDMLAEFGRTRTGVLTLDKLQAIGLLSSPVLSTDLAGGIPSYDYMITGSVQLTDPTAKALEAKKQTEYIESILKGGSLPVGISLGSRTTLPAALGEEFLRLSLIGIAAALIVISLLIGLRYKNIKATLPIVAISLAELVILIAILGSFTIDLAAMAGILAAIGVGVDAQIVITDEILKKDENTIEEKTEHAFSIIKMNAIVASLSMLPLFFSGIVEIIGFAISTILGSLLGYLLSRPAYAVIVEKILGIEEKQ